MFTAQLYNTCNYIAIPDFLCIDCITVSIVRLLVARTHTHTRAHIFQNCDKHRNREKNILPLQINLKIFINKIFCDMYANLTIVCT